MLGAILGIFFRCRFFCLRLSHRSTKERSAIHWIEPLARFHLDRAQELVFIFSALIFRISNPARQSRQLSQTYFGNNILAESNDLRHDWCAE